MVDEHIGPKRRFKTSFIMYGPAPTVACHEGADANKHKPCHFVYFKHSLATKHSNAGIVGLWSGSNQYKCGNRRCNNKSNRTIVFEWL